MKNLKKVLAMVLAFACTFTMFASAKLYEDVPAGSDFSEAITMLSDLGVIQGKTDNKYHPEDTITRAEACALIARLMTGDPNAAGFNNAHHFKDVPAGFWASSAIGYCVVNGIAIGVDQAGTKFEPQRPIKDKEFVTMIVRALGYETPDMRNNFPFGYMSAANAIGLLQGVNMVPDTDALRGEDAQVIYNAMFVDYARGAKRVNVAHGTTVESYPTLAEDVWHLNRAALGTWNKKDDEDVTLSNCKAHNWVILGAAQDEENSLLALAIDDNEDTDLYKAEEKKHEYKAYKFKYEGTADIDALRGYKVELWGAGKHGEPVWEKDGDKFVYSNDWKIKAIKSVKGQTKFDYNASMADKKDHDGEIQIDEETKLKLESAADNAKLVKQEQGVKEVVTFAADELNTIKVKDDEALEQALNVRNGMQYRLMDWNGDKEIDWVVVDEARYYKVDSATSKRVVVTSMAGDNLKSDKDSVTETWKLDDSEKIGKNLAGKDVKIKYEAPEGLKEGDIVEVTYKVTYEDKAQLITATVKVVDADNQKLEEVGTKDGLTLTFGDKELKVAQNARKDGGDVIVPANPESYKGFNGEELGTEFALFKNRNGFIVYSDYATESSNYMMVLNTAGGKDTTGGRDLAMIDFVDANNVEHKDVKVSSGARVLDKNGDTMNRGNLKAYEDRVFDELQVVGNVFKYWTDADGVITKMQAVFTTDDAKAKTEKTEYEYDTDADRLINKDGKYIASLEDANVIFAVKSDYLREDFKTDKPVAQKFNDLYVDAADVLATKQKDIPDIGGGADTQDEALLGKRSGVMDTWLGINTDNKNKFVVNLNKNSEATAAVLGVDNFNKFNSGSTKLGLVTNVSERNGGTIKADVAFDGKVETISSAEKQDFEDIVKVFDGKDDKDIIGVDAMISASGNGVFDGKKLSTVVNEGGQYAEITTDADGKLTKLVFLDDVKGNDNKLQGHYYSVSRNLVLNVSDKNLRYGINDNTRPQFFADDSKLYSTGRLEAESSGYTSEAKFYTVDAKPSRHDKKYDATRLTVNAGFDNLDQRDIKAAEKTDIEGHEPNYNSNKNDYNVADLAFNSDNDLVAVYSFKTLDEKAATNLAAVNVTNAKDSYKPGETVELTAKVTYSHDATANKLDGIKVFDKDGKVVATLSAKTGSGTDTITAEWKIPQSITTGEYTFKAVYGSTVFEGGSKISVDTGNTKFAVSEVQLANWNSGNPTHTNNAFNKVDGNSFYVYVGGVARASEGVVGLTADNFYVEIDGVKKSIDTTKFADKGNGYYLIALQEVDFNSTHNAKNMSIEVKGIETAVGLDKLTVTTTDGTVGQGGTVAQSTGTVAGVGNVATVAITKLADGVEANPVKTLEVTLTTADQKKVIGVQKSDFTVTNATITQVDENSGVYTLTFQEDIRGKQVTVEVNKKSDTVDVPAQQISIVVAPDTLTVTQNQNASGNATVTLTGVDDETKLKIWLENEKYTDQTEATHANGLKATLSNKQITLSETPTQKETIKFYVGVGDQASEKAVLTVNVEAPALSNTVASDKQEGIKEVQAVKATATYPITKAGDGSFKLKIGEGAETEEITAATDNNTTANNAKAALEKAYGSEYDFTVATNKITITAKTAKKDQTIPTLTVSTGTDKATVGTVEGEQTGVEAVSKQAGRVKFKIAGTATKDDAGQWEVTIGTKKIEVTVSENDDPAKIAKAIETALTSDADLQATAAGDTVTITEKSGKEGTICTTNFVATFAKK